MLLSENVLQTHLYPADEVVVEPDHHSLAQLAFVMADVVRDDFRAKLRRT